MPNNELPPRPTNPTPVNCPGCGHNIDDHNGFGTDHDPCPCDWTPNDIAWQILFGGLTPTNPQKVTNRGDGSWQPHQDWS